MPGPWASAPNRYELEVMWVHVVFVVKNYRPSNFENFGPSDLVLECTGEYSCEHRKIMKLKNS